MAPRSTVRQRGRFAGLDIRLQRGRILVRDHGLAFGMHNHWWEFEPLDGVRPIRRLHELLHPDTFWQLDVYWAQVAGADPAEVVSELGPRLRSLHWKDGPCIPEEPMTALGEGKVDLRKSSVP